MSASESILQGAALVLVAALGAVVVFSRRPLHQGLAVGLFGLALTVLFVVFRAPGVALSMVVVGVVALPLMIALALAKIREHDRPEGEKG